jgi:hypothetical protein
MKGITFIPTFLERLAQSEAEFEAGKPRWRPDRSRSFYEQWSGYRDVLDRLAGPTSGAFTAMDLAEITIRRRQPRHARQRRPGLR